MQSQRDRGHTNFSERMQMRGPQSLEQFLEMVTGGGGSMDEGLRALLGNNFEGVMRTSEISSGVGSRRRGRSSNTGESRSPARSRPSQSARSSG